LRHRIASFLDSLSEEEHKNQHRRMSKDYERLAETSEAFIYVAMSRLMVRRLAHR
jgi:transposase